MATRRGNNDTDEAITGPLESGRRCYQLKDYEGALEAFTQAVTISSDHMLMTALDHRAATYEKLKQFRPALRDAKQMIEMKPEFAKGYLRCAKVLQLMGDDGLALKIYERGLTKVKIGGDEDRTILQSMFNKLQRQQAPRESLDPLEKLPIELAEVVCQYLGMRDRVICLSVSKSWKRVLESSPKLWTVLDTTAARRAVTEKSLRAYLKRSKYTLQEAKITMAQERRGGFNEAKINYLMQSCKQLEHLEIRGPGTIGESLTKTIPHAQELKTLYVHSNCQIPASCVGKALGSTRETLKEASFLSVALTSRWQTFTFGWPECRFESLTVLRLRAIPFGGVAPPLFVSEFWEKFPNLTVLCLSQWNIGMIAFVSFAKWTNLRHLDISDNSLRDLPTLPPTLEYLDISRNRLMSSQLRLASASSVLASIMAPSKLPLLKYFNCYGTELRGSMVGAITMPSIEAGSLKALHVGGSDSTTYLPLATIKESFQASGMMEEFSIADTYMEEKAVLQIVRQYPKLRSLDVSGTKVTGVAVKEFVGMGIKSLKLNECPYISPDALEYARGKGVEVESRFPSRGTTARSFRDTPFV